MEAQSSRLTRAARGLVTRLDRFRRGQRIARREPAPAPVHWRRTVQARLIVCAVAFGAWTMAVEARLVYLQVFEHAALQELADRQQLRTIKLSPKRGEIFDRHGRLLAYSVDADTIGADPSAIDGDPDEVARLVCEALDGCRSQQRADMADRLRTGRRFAYLARHVSPAAARRVRDLDLPGLVLLRESRRYYPNKEMAAHVLGFVSIDNEGLGGVESRFDERIRGREGALLVHTDGHQRAMAVREERLPTAGDSLELTLDQQLQHIAEREIRAGVEGTGAAAGTAIIMQPQTGDILALANWPTFNPNKHSSASPETRRNRAVQEIYEPGSTFKIVTASAALEEGVLGPDDPIDCSPGYITFGSRTIRDVNRYGVLSFTDVIVKSSNVGAIRAGLLLGPERLVRYMARFGFGQRLAPDFRGETAGLVERPERLNSSALASVSMGYQVAVTPLQMAAAVSAIANGGTLFEPRVVRAVVRDGQRDEVAPKPLRQAITPQTAATLTAMMEEVVTRGTARSARIPGYSIAGKTGTARKAIRGGYSTTDYHASFVGFVPSRRPELAIIVVIDSPRRGQGTHYYGGVAAAPIFKRIAEASLRHLGVPPNLNARPPVLVARGAADEGMVPRPVSGPSLLEPMLDVARSGVMPDLRGLGAREALRLLTQIGLVARLQGNGVVIEQQPLPGTPIEPGDSLVITLGRRIPSPAAGGATP